MNTSVDVFLFLWTTIYIVQSSGILLFFCIFFYVIWSRSDRVTLFSSEIANITCCDDVSDDMGWSSSRAQTSFNACHCIVICFGWNNFHTTENKYKQFHHMWGETVCTYWQSLSMMNCTAKALKTSLLSHLFWLKQRFLHNSTNSGPNDMVFFAVCTPYL